MNNLEIMLRVGQLEVRFADNQQVLDDLDKFAENIVNNKPYVASRTLGHLVERIGENDSSLKSICDWFFSDDAGYTTQIDDPTQISIDDLDFSVITYNCLKRKGVHTVKDILAIQSGEWLKMKNFRNKNYLEVGSKLKALGLEISPLQQ